MSRSAILATALVGLAAVPAHAAAPPVRAAVGPVECRDLSAIAQVAPSQIPSRAPVVQVDLHGDGLDRAVPYEVRADGERRLAGTIDKGGYVGGQVGLPNGRTVRVEIVVDGQPVLDKMVPTGC